MMNEGRILSLQIYFVSFKWISIHKKWVDLQDIWRRKKDIPFRLSFNFHLPRSLGRRLKSAAAALEKPTWSSPDTIMHFNRSFQSVVFDSVMLHSNSNILLDKALSSPSFSRYSEFRLRFSWYCKAQNLLQNISQMAPLSLYRMK